MQDSRESSDLRSLYRACRQIYCIYLFLTYREFARAILTFSLDYEIALLEHLLMLHRRNRRKELTKNHLDATRKDYNLDKI
jgi:hypothetical protein